MIATESTMIEDEALEGGWKWLVFREESPLCTQYSCIVYYDDRAHPIEGGWPGVMYYGPICLTLEELHALKDTVIKKARATYREGDFSVTDDRVVIRNGAGH